MQRLINILHQEQCSLVVKSVDGEIVIGKKKGVRDLMWFLSNAPQKLKGAIIADKVVGRAAAGLMVRGGVIEVYADIMSRLAIPLLKEANIIYDYKILVENIVIKEGDNRCPLEDIVKEADSAEQVENLLKNYFLSMPK